jgi:hypothetical protein
VDHTLNFYLVITYKKKFKSNTYKSELLNLFNLEGHSTFS